MDDKRNSRNAAGDAGLIYKSAQLETQEVNEAELAAINKHTLAPLTADEVFTFSAVLCDNAVDRQHEYFSDKALKDMQKLFVGKTVIKDHAWAADNQVARIYATEVVETGKTLDDGRPYKQLKAHCYMVRTEGNKDLIAEIKAGIKKEGSIGCRAASSICSVCGTDNSKLYCPHWPGRSYHKDGQTLLCTFKLDGVKDAYEFSLVAVPAQRQAGTCKSYTGETVYAPAEEPAQTDEKVNDKAAEQEQAKLLELRARMTGIDITNH